MYVDPTKTLTENLLDREFNRKDDRLRMQPEPQAEPEQEQDLASMTVAQLESLADDESIDLTGATLKADIILRIEAARVG